MRESRFIFFQREGGRVREISEFAGGVNSIIYILKKIEFSN